HDFDFTFSDLAGYGFMYWLKNGGAVLLVILKLIAICAFIMITSPTCTHALMDAGWEDGIDPELKDRNLTI
ncbi:MAG: monovalent cation/H(+) antiporter subunit G, partial [Verrucomicrobiota bacterium]